MSEEPRWCSWPSHSHSLYRPAHRNISACPVIHLFHLLSPPPHYVSTFILAAWNAILFTGLQAVERGLVLKITSSTFNLACPSLHPPLRHHGWCHAESNLCNQHFTAPILCESNPVYPNQPISPAWLSAKQFGTHFEEKAWQHSKLFSLASLSLPPILLSVSSSNPTGTDLLSVSARHRCSVLAAFIVQFFDPSLHSSFAPLLLTPDDLEISWYALRVMLCLHRRRGRH